MPTLISNTVTHQQRIQHYFSQLPQTAGALFVADNATCIGAVRLGERSSVFYQAVLRGDINEIVIGEETNIQDGVVVHVSDDYPCIVGNRVTVGHKAILHACTIEDECLIGMGATVLDGAVIGARSIVGANALVTGRFRAPPGSMILGSPAKVVRMLTQEEQEALPLWAEKYLLVAEAHRDQERCSSRGECPQN